MTPARAAQSSASAEQPLPAAARVRLTFAAAATILAFYALAVALIPLLLLQFLLLAIAALGAARIGAAGFVTPLMEPPATIVGILARQLWLPRSVEYRLPLQQADAMSLFTVANTLAQRLGVRSPGSIVVEMHTSAWVNLRGLRRGGGSTIGLGFDLLAALTVAEVEAVLAHELAHARLVQRGLVRWLNRGVARLANVSRGLHAYQTAKASSTRPSDLATWTDKLFDRLTGRAVRLAATYSRQDEFDADRAAAELCGASILRSALSKIEALQDAAGRLPWNERLARLQGSGFSQWLTSSLGPLVERARQEPAHHVADPYSTHPTLLHRFAALPTDDRAPPQGGSGLDLLARPDDVAERLAVEVQRVAAKEEVAHSKRLAKETRKLTHRTSLRGWPLLGRAAIAFGILVLLLALPWGPGSGSSIQFGAASIAVGGIVLLARRHRDKVKLPVPEYGTFTSTIVYETHEALQAAETQLVDRYYDETRDLRSGTARFAYLLRQCTDALAQRDYLRAHVTARLALDIKEKSVEAWLGYGIAAASLGNGKQTQTAIDHVRRLSGFNTNNTRWGAAWALVMLNDVRAEALLQRLHRDEPRVASYLALLAMVQLVQGKVHSATRHARAAVSLSPNDASIELLLEALIAAGSMREAASVANGREENARRHPRTALRMVRLRLMLQDVMAAQEWAEIVRDLSREEESRGEWLVALGAVFGYARQDAVSQALFEDALTTPYHVQANIGLADLAQAAGQSPKARLHLLAALRMKGGRVIGTETPADLLHGVIGRLVGLEQQRVECRGWIAAIPRTALVPLAGTSVLVFAEDIDDARAYLSEVTSAMLDSGATFDQTCVSWRDAPTEHQPVRPVAPGVRLVFNG